ncbi:MAG: hypothetical protein V1729_03185 [Candidatus Woesearchaeota archaeon]
MKKSVVLISVLLSVISLLLIGCSQNTPEAVCNPPYMTYKTGCCMDQNSNSVCDDEEDILFEPNYIPSEIPYDDVDYNDLSDIDHVDALKEPEVQAPKPPVEKATTPKVEYSPAASPYAAVRPEITGWEAETEFMSMKVTGMVIEVVETKSKDLKTSEKIAYLKEVHLEVKNKKYAYINSKFQFRLMDERDAAIISDTSLCDSTDDIQMEGCRNLPEGEIMKIIMHIDRDIPRLDMKKTIRITLENKRDIKTVNIIKIEKDIADILNIVGADYI